MDYYDDFYDEPNEFEQMIDEFKQSLVKSVKQEHRDWLEFYKAEAKSEVIRGKLHEILKELQVILYQCKMVYKDREKCSLCNDNREIEYLTPLGNKAKEKCTCATRLSEYQPSENILYEFREETRGIVVFYKYNESSNFTNGYYVLEHYEDSRNPRKIYGAGEYSDEKIQNTYVTYFRSREDCQKACDILNKGEIL
jgi:hypothetical protein